LDGALTRGVVGLITGASGAGKSTLLRAVAERRRGAGGVVIDAAPIALEERPAVELVGATLEGAMRALARAGLGEAACFVRKPREMSDGQRARLRLALALERGAAVGGRAGALIVADEFGATLDRATARAVAALSARRVRGGGAGALLVATAHDDLSGALRADVHVRAAGAGVFERVERADEASVGEADGFEIAPGSPADLTSLGHLHYCAGAPATVVRVLAARAPGERGAVGALAVSMPTLNGSWRDVAWPGRYRSGDRRRDARRLNEEVRCISRVIVDPRLRGLGLATRLVRAYLADPLTERTEAVASMGRVTRFFARAGMTEHGLAPAARHARLAGALRRVGVEPWRLARPAALARSLEKRPGARAFLEWELRHWANESRATRRAAGAGVEGLLRLAAGRVGAPPVAYTHTRGEGGA
jgi:ABC-type lipoprotein export system ATPase subunit